MAFLCSISLSLLSNARVARVHAYTGHTNCIEPAVSEKRSFEYRASPAARLGAAREGAFTSPRLSITAISYSFLSHKPSMTNTRLPALLSISPCGRCSPGSKHNNKGRVTRHTIYKLFINSGSQPMKKHKVGSVG